MNLWKHQTIAINAALNKKNLALFHDVGTGKTCTMINILRHDYTEHKRVRRTLILCPITVCKQWKDEFAKFSKVPQENIFVLVGEGKKRVQLVEELTRLQQNAVLITNYEAVQIKGFVEALDKYNIEVMIADESHRLKDSSGVRSKKIYALADKADRKFIMTGTPFLNSMLDIFGQFRFLDKTVFGKSFFEFRMRYFEDKNRHMPSHVHFPDWQPRPDSSSKIAGILTHYCVQANKHECLDLPPLIKQVIPVELGVDQRRAYEMMKKEFVAEIGGNLITAEFAMTKTLRMQQILSGFIPNRDNPDDTVWCDKVPRLQALSDLLESINGKKTIVWTVFRPTYRAIERVCQELDLKCNFLTGEQTQKEKEHAINEFRNGPTQVLIANPAAGGTGINLIEAQYAIYYSRSFSLEHFLQSEARNFRGGSNMHEKVTHYHLVSQGTLDEVISNALLHKKNMGDEVLNFAKKLLTS